ncbi:MAG: 50S ribosome-binding GTPase, partial [Syntrophomonadaceae bacterium]|nr:50S ribosome-binding GTPase [Syntrophomonadaceae bacterium]
LREEYINRGEHMNSNGKTPNIKYTAHIDELISRYDSFLCLKEKSIFEYDNESIRNFISNGYHAEKHSRYVWDVSGIQYFDRCQKVSILNAIFIGKTGYGKSSLLNYILGKNIFAVNDISACTKEVDMAVFRMGLNEQYYISFADLPGMGESKKADSEYFDSYRKMLLSSECVVYTLRADQRDYSIDELVFQQLFPNEDEKSKVIIALNFADKIEPLTRDGEITEEQAEALEEKITQIETIFKIESYKIFPCSARTGYGVSSLVNEITDLLEMNVFDE